MNEARRIRKPLEITEKQFFEMYYNIMNISLSKKLADMDIKVLTEFSIQPLNFYLDTKRAPNNKSKKYVLAEAIGIEHTSVYRNLKNLIKAGVMIPDTDGFLNLNPHLSTIRKQVKQDLENTGEFNLDYLFEFRIK